MSMNIYSRPGDKVRFANPNNGLAADRAKCAELLTLGVVYTVERCEVYSSHTVVRLREFPGHVFNSVVFDDADKPTPNTLRVRLVDRWCEDDYAVALYSDSPSDGATYSLWVERDGHDPREVTDDIDAYCRRIEALVAELYGVARTPEQRERLRELSQRAMAGGEDAAVADAAIEFLRELAR